MKLKVYFFLACLITFFYLYPLSYDYALYTAQKGDIKSAEEQLRNIIINDPDNADVLYAAGSFANEMNNFKQARAYFERAAHYFSDKNLQVQAYFNAGNASVADKNLKEALEYYDKALSIDQDNEYVRHNRDRVKQMLEEQQNQQDNNNQEKDQKDQQKGEQDKQSQDKNDEEQKENNDQKNDQDGDQQNNSGGSSNTSNQQSQGDQGNEPEEGNDSKQRKQQRNKDENRHNPANNEQGDGKQKFNEKSEGADKKGDKQQSKQHGKSPEQQNTQDNKNKDSIPSSDTQEQGKDADPKTADGHQTENLGEQSGQVNKAHNMQSIDQKINDPWLANILKDQEQNDKTINKKLMEAKIRQHGGKNAQNCW